ncbi:unnamed protein product [Paramecium octaurelia]|uniref:Uncharacterized protein n=1 Tax=Paramecium octaurelia TaxID=43137 RepID=A0A8S1VJD3_PAROT|nr:unnamed protein product [Paramecium octaurelia]
MQCLQQIYIARMDNLLFNNEIYFVIIYCFEMKKRINLTAFKCLQNLKFQATLFNRWENKTFNIKKKFQYTDKRESNIQFSWKFQNHNIICYMQWFGSYTDCEMHNNNELFKFRRGKFVLQRNAIYSQQIEQHFSKEFELIKKTNQVLQKKFEMKTLVQYFQKVEIQILNRSHLFFLQENPLASKRNMSTQKLLIKSSF